MTKIDIQQMLDTRPEYRYKLYERGFLVTDQKINDQVYPFYGLWNHVDLFGYCVLVSPEQTAFFSKESDGAFVLIGHAYDPVRMMKNEEDILSQLCSLWHEDQCSFWNRLCDLSGNYTLLRISSDELIVVGDATGMQTTFYCRVNDGTYISSHTNCIGDLLNLPWDSYVERLAGYRFFHLFGNSLPGDLTQYSQVKRLVPNHYICLDNGNFASHRFYWPCRKQVSSNDIVNQTAALLQNSLELIAQKWDRPAISTTGGCDSKTTLACASKHFEKFRYYSYISSDSEKVDAEAAHKICDNLGLKHDIHIISDRDSDYPDVEIVRALLFWNSGGILMPNKNDVRKRCYFMQCNDFDVEVKSWASEIGRAYYSKRFAGRTDFGSTPTPRKCTTLYKVFFHNRQLVRETDRVFEEYLNSYFDQDKVSPIEWQEQFFWEFRVASWNGLVITGEHSFTDTIVIPYNNRRILELLLSMPLEGRLRDTAYSSIREKMDSRIDETGIAIQNLKHTKIREKVENIYYSIHSLLPF